MNFSNCLNCNFLFHKVGALWRSSEYFNQITSCFHHGSVNASKTTNPFNRLSLNGAPIFHVRSFDVVLPTWIMRVLRHLCVLLRRWIFMNMYLNCSNCKKEFWVLQSNNELFSIRSDEWFANMKFILPFELKMISSFPRIYWWQCNGKFSQRPSFWQMKLVKAFQQRELIIHKQQVFSFHIVHKHSSRTSPKSSSMRI